MFDLNRPPPANRDTIVRLATDAIGKPEHEVIRGYHSNALGKPWPGPMLQWCGLFCLSMLHDAGVATKVKWKLGGGFCEEEHLARVKLPEPGDIAYYAHPWQHHALVHSVDTDRGTFDSIDGNQAADTVVLRRGTPLTKATCFYSIARLLRAGDTDPSPPPEPA